MEACDVDLQTGPESIPAERKSTVAFTTHGLDSFGVVFGR